MQSNTKFSYIKLFSLSLFLILFACHHSDNKHQPNKVTTIKSINYKSLNSVNKNIGFIYMLYSLISTI